jgi:hypothetical protein
VCIILEYDLLNVRYIYPFDTGAFKAGAYPNFVNMMDLNDYNVSADSEAPQKIIGSFFADPLSYYRTKARDINDFTNRYTVDILDEEVKALHALITSRMPRSADDRRASIEVSFNADLALPDRKVLAVVFPEIYLENEEIMGYIEKTLAATPISYPIYTQNVSFYFSCIYTLVEQFYQQKKFFNV